MLKKRWLQIAIVCTTVLVLSLATGVVYQANATMQDMTLHPASGQLVIVDGTDKYARRFDGTGHEISASCYCLSLQARKLD